MIQTSSLWTKVKKRADYYYYCFCLMSTTTNNDIRKDDDNDETPWYLVRPSSFNTTTTIHIDGRTGEGGGQILRNAMAYATLLQHPDVHINHIRGGRSKPGLQAQHVASIQLPVELTALESSQQRRNPSIENSNNNDDATAVLTGDTVGSMEIRYRPLSTNTTKAIEEEESTTHNPDQGTSPSSPWIVEKDIGTAGSICLLLQASLPSALLVARHRPVQLILKGGTNATFAPQYDYWQYVFLPMLQHCCRVSPHHIRGHVVRRGYFPRGGGIVDVHVQPLVSALPAFDLTHRGTRLASLYIRAFHAGRIPRRVAHDMAAAAKMCLQQQHSSLGQSMMIRDETNKEDDNNTQCNLQVDIVTETNAVGNGWGILIVATTDTGCKLAGSALGSTTRSRNNHSPTRAQAQTVGRSAAHELITAWDAGGCVDEWLQDQLIIFMALAEGESKMFDSAYPNGHLDGATALSRSALSSDQTTHNRQRDV